MLKYIKTTFLVLISSILVYSQTDSSLIKYSGTGGTTTTTLQEVLDGQGVNILSFGAKPNDLTFDQSKAFNDAITYAANNHIGKVVGPSARYAANILMNVSGITLSLDMPQNWEQSKEYITPWDITKPAIQIGNDTGNIYGITLDGITLNGTSPNGTGTVGLFLAGGINGLVISKCATENFSNNGVQVGPSSNYPIEYVSFSDCNFGPHYSATFNNVFCASGNSTSWTSAIYFSNCNLIANTWGCMMTLQGVYLAWHGGWLQGNTNYGIKFIGNAGTVGLLHDAGNIEIAGGGDAFDITDTTHTNITSWINGTSSINTSDQIKDGNGILHDINNMPDEFNYGKHFLGQQFFTGFNGNGASATNKDMYISGGYDITGYFDFVNKTGILVKSRLAADGTFRIESNGGLQMVVNPRANATNYFNIWASTGTDPVELQAREATGLVAVPFNFKTQLGAPVQANGYNILSTKDSISTNTYTSLTSTSSSTSVMMGTGNTITPNNSTRVLFSVNGQVTNSVINSSVSVEIRYGTGTAPTNGSIVAGNLIGIAQTNMVVTNGQKFNFSITAPVINLKVGTTYWYDISIKTINGGIASVSNVTSSAIEM